MSGPKCIIHDSVCVTEERTQTVVTTVADPSRHFGLWVPPGFLYALHDPDSPDFWLINRFHDIDFVNLKDTIGNLNRLKSEFGFNAISIGVEEFIDVYTWTPFLLFDAFMHPDCLWRLDELLLALGNGCHDWALPALRLFRQLTGNANVLAVCIDEPLLDNRSFKENGQEKSNFQWCKQNYFDDYETRTVRIQALYEEVHRNGDRFIISESERVANLWILGIWGTTQNFHETLKWANGFLYNGYSIGCAIGPSSCTLPIQMWRILQSQYKTRDRSFGVWIANSCHKFFYERPIVGIKAVCQKDYFNTLLAAARRLQIQDVFLYGGDLALEILWTCLDFSGPFRVREPELTEAVVRKILSCGLPFDRSLYGVYFDRCPAFRSAVLKIFWRRLEQYRRAAVEEKILMQVVKQIPTGRKSYCTAGPSRYYQGYSVIDCANCAKWEDAPRGVRFCPPDFAYAPMRKSITVPPAGSRKIPISAPPSPYVLHKQTPGIIESDMLDGPEGEMEGVERFSNGDEPVPPAQRRYTVIYLLR